MDLLCCADPSLASGERLRRDSWASMSEPCADAGWEGGLLRLVGRDIFRALWYKPQALQMVDPLGDRRQRGVCVVPQLLYKNVSAFVEGAAENCPRAVDAHLQTCPRAGELFTEASCASA